MTLAACLLVSLGGAVGSLLRYIVSAATASISRQLPWGTIAINVAGSFLIALWGAAASSHPRLAGSDNARMFVMIGVCGGFTTFSSFSLQTFDLMRNGATGRAALNVVLSMVLCLLAVALGHLAGSRLGSDA